MSYPFPPPFPANVGMWFIVGNLLLIVIALAAALGVFRKDYNQNWRTRWYRLSTAIGGVTTLLVMGMLLEENRMYANVYLVFAWLAIGPTCVISVIRQVRGKLPGTGIVLALFVASGLLPFLGSPAISLARGAAWRAYCKSQLRNIGTVYVDAQTNENRFSRVLLRPSDGEPPQSWRTWLFFSYDKPFSEFDLQSPWNDPVNLGLGRQKFEPVLCPANFNPTDNDGRYFTAYAAVTGPETAFPNGEALPLSKFTDGTAYTIIYGEATGLRIGWTEPRDIDISREPIGINLPGKRRGHSLGTLSSHHLDNRGATVVMADGSVRFLSERIDPAVLKAVLTATGRDDPFHRY